MAEASHFVETHICVSGRALNYHFGLYLRGLLTPRIGAFGAWVFYIACLLGDANMRLYWIYVLSAFFAAPRSADVALRAVGLWFVNKLVETHICVSGRALNYLFGLYLRGLLTPRIGAFGAWVFLYRLPFGRRKYASLQSLCLIDVLCRRLRMEGREPMSRCSAFCP